jgi:hypothetical protein
VCHAVPPRCREGLTMGEEEVDLPDSILYRVFRKRCHDGLFVT